MLIQKANTDTIWNVGKNRAATCEADHAKASVSRRENAQPSYPHREIPRHQPEEVNLRPYSPRVQKRHKWCRGHEYTSRSRDSDKGIHPTSNVDNGVSARNNSLPSIFVLVGPALIRLTGGFSDMKLKHTLISNEYLFEFRAFKRYPSVNDDCAGRFIHSARVAHN